MANAYGTTTHMTTAVSHAEYISRHLDAYLADTLQGTVRYEPTKNQLADIIQNTLHSLATALKAADACQLDIRSTIQPMLIEVYSSLEADKLLVNDLDATSRSSLSVRLTDMLYDAASEPSQPASTATQPETTVESSSLILTPREDAAVDAATSLAQVIEASPEISCRSVAADAHDTIVEEHEAQVAKTSKDAAKSKSRFAQLPQLTHDLKEAGLTAKHKYELIHRIDAAFSKDYHFLPQPIEELISHLHTWFHTRYIDYGTGKGLQGYNINEVFINIACMCGSYGKCYDDYQESKFDSGLRYYLESCQKLSAAGKKIYDLTTDAKAIKNACFYASPAENDYAVASLLSSRSFLFTHFVMAYVLHDVSKWLHDTPWHNLSRNWGPGDPESLFFETTDGDTYCEYVPYYKSISNAVYTGTVAAHTMVPETVRALFISVDRTVSLESDTLDKALDAVWSTRWNMLAKFSKVDPRRSERIDTLDEDREAEPADV